MLKKDNSNFENHLNSRLNLISPRLQGLYRINIKIEVLRSNNKDIDKEHGKNREKAV